MIPQEGEELDRLAPILEHESLIEPIKNRRTKQVGQLQTENSRYSSRYMILQIEMVNVIIPVFHEEFTPPRLASIPNRT